MDKRRMPEASFVTFVLDQLRGLGAVECRAMFGGHGLSHRGRFFGILFRGRLYFKTDERTRPAYVARGMPPFRPSARQTLTSYYEVPTEVLEDEAHLVAWANQALVCVRDTTSRRHRQASVGLRRIRHQGTSRSRA